MDIASAYSAFLTELGLIDELTIIGPSIFSTYNNWPLPALTIDIDVIPLGSTSEEGKIVPSGLSMPMCLHLPIDMTRTRDLVLDALAWIDRILPAIGTCFGSDYLLTLSDVYATVVPFGQGEAFGYGFTLLVSQA